MSRKKAPYFAVMILTLTVCCLATISAASVFHGKGRYFVTRGDTIDDDLYLGVSEGALDGVITGDAVIAARKYSVTGEIKGSLNSASQFATIRGGIGNSVRMFAQTVTIEGTIGKNLLVFGDIIDLSENSLVGKDVTIFGGDVSLSGNVGGNALIKCNELILSGKIAGDVDIRAEKISILAPAEITGNITYKSKEEIKIGDGVIIGGKVDWQKVKPGEDGEKDVGVGWAMRLLLFTASLVTGLLLIALTNRHVRAATEQIVTKPLMTLGIGFVVFCVAPVAVIILLILIIGIPAAIILLFTYTVFFYIAKIYVAIALGRVGIKALRKDAAPKAGWCLLVGLVVLTILFMIPQLGWIVYFVTIFWGFGAILLGIRECRWGPRPAPAGDATSSPMPQVA